MCIEKLPYHLVVYIQQFLFPSKVDESFDARVYPIKKQLEYKDMLKEGLRARQMKPALNILVYSRLYITLPDNEYIFNLVCDLDIIDTLIFEPHVEYFYLNNTKLKTNNGVYRPTIRSNNYPIQWFFVPRQSMLSDVIVYPRPRALIGGFVNRMPRNTFQITDGILQYEYNRNNCIISVV